MDENFSLGPWGRASQEQPVDSIEESEDVTDEILSDPENVEAIEEALEDLAEGRVTPRERVVTYTRGPNGKLVVVSDS